VMWLVTTLTVLPMLLIQSGTVAVQSAVPQKTALRALEPYAQRGSPGREARAARQSRAEGFFLDRAHRR